MSEHFQRLLTRARSQLKRLYDDLETGHREDGSTFHNVHSLWREMIDVAFDQTRPLAEREEERKELSHFGQGMTNYVKRRNMKRGGSR